MATLDKIKEATKRYADNRELLSLRVANLHTEIEELKRKHMPEILEAASDTANARMAVDQMIDESRGVFVKPRSVIVSGIKVGLQKAKGTIEYDDVDAVIGRIEKVITDPVEQKKYVKTTKKLIAAGLEALPVHTLKRIGVNVIEAGDRVLVKPVNSDIDKLVTAMLKEAAGEVDEMEDAA